MNVFLSFSGRISHQTAEVLAWWLPRVHQKINPFLSSDDIDKGLRWQGELAQVLDTHSFGIICINRENLNSVWVNFEAGALSKSVKHARVSPFLLGIDKADVRSSTPLGIFQSTAYEKQELQRLIGSFNDVMGEDKLESEALSEAFEMWWPRLRERLDPLEEHAKHLAEPQPPPVTVTGDEMLKEVLELSREQWRLLSSPETFLATTLRNYLFNPTERDVVSELAGHFNELRRLSSTMMMEKAAIPEFRALIRLLTQDIQSLTRLAELSNRFLALKTDHYNDETQLDIEDLDAVPAILKEDQSSNPDEPLGGASMDDIPF